MSVYESIKRYFSYEGVDVKPTEHPRAFEEVTRPNAVEAVLDQPAVSDQSMRSSAPVSLSKEQTLDPASISALDAGESRQPGAMFTRPRWLQSDFVVFLLIAACVAFVVTSLVWMVAMAL